MKKFTVLLMSIVMMFCAFPIAGCVNSIEDPYTPTNYGKLPSKIDGVDYSPLKKYDKLTSVSAYVIEYPKLGSLPDYYMGKPIGASNHSFLTVAAKTLNVKFTNFATVTGGNYETSLNTRIAANNSLPDLFLTSDPTTFERLKASGMIADIAPTFYNLNEQLQKMYNDPIYYPALESCMVDGKLYAFPNVNNPYETAQRIYIRQDWLDLLSLSVPSTYEQLVAVAKAFKDNASKIAGSMSQVNAKDIVPIGITKEVATAGNNTAQGFFNIFGTQPNTFVEKDGKLVDVNTSEEMKNALKELNSLYSQGLISKEFYNATHTKVTNDIISGKVGIISGMWHAASSPLQQSVENSETPSAQWTSIDLPSYKGVKAKPFVETVSIQSYLMVSKSFVDRGGDAAALAKICNLFYDMFYSNDAVEKYGADATPEGGFFYSWVPVKLWYTPYSMQSYERLWGVFNELYDNGFRISDAKYAEMMKSDFSWSNWYTTMSNDEKYGVAFNKLIIRERENGFKYGYPYFQAIKAGKKTANMNIIEKKGFGIYEQSISNVGGFGYVSQLVNKEKEVVVNKFYGTKTPAQQNYGEYLDTSFKTFALETIKGDKNVDNAWKNYVTNYNNNGGEAVLSQINQWYGYKKQ